MSKICRAMIYINEKPVISDDGICLYAEGCLGCIVLPDDGEGYLISLAGYDQSALEENLNLLVESGAADIIANGVSLPLDQVCYHLGTYKVVREFTVEIKEPDWASFNEEIDPDFGVEHDETVAEDHVKGDQ